MNYSKPKVTLEKYTLAEAVMADNYSAPIMETSGIDGEEDAAGTTTASVSSSTLNAFGEVFDFSNK